MIRVAVFLDGANYFFMQKDGLGWFADPKKLLKYFRKYGEITDAYYYIGQDAPPDARQQAYLDALPLMGYSVVSKPIKTIFDVKNGTQKRKANLDVEIVLDMFNTIENYDMAILVSGDGDFERPLQLLKSRGKQFRVFATEKYVAREIRNVSGMHYVDLKDIKSEIIKDDKIGC